MSEGTRYKLDASRSLVLVVDVQERLAAAMDPDALQSAERALTTLVRGAELLSVPVVATEQYPRGLGPTRGAVRECLTGAPIEKMTFSCWEEPLVRAAVESSGRSQIVICGMETHVCVYQTARDLVHAGLDAWVVSDAVVSRTEANKRVGLTLIGEAGGLVTGSEVVLFDWLGTANHPKFKDVSRLVK